MAGDDVLDIAERVRAYGEAWRATAVSTELADRPQAERAIGSLYRAAGRPSPKVVWVDSPAAGLVAAAFAAKTRSWIRGTRDDGRHRTRLEPAVERPRRAARPRPALDAPAREARRGSSRKSAPRGGKPHLLGSDGDRHPRLRARRDLDDPAAAAPGGRRGSRRAGVAGRRRGSTRRCSSDSAPRCSASRGPC